MTGFFEENEGERSMMRLCFFISVSSMCALAFVIEIWGTWNIYNSGLITGVISVASWMKAKQKSQELEI